MTVSLCIEVLVHICVYECVLTKQSKTRYQYIACRHILCAQNEGEKYVRIIVRLQLFILKFVCDADSIKFKTDSSNRYEKNIGGKEDCQSLRYISFVLFEILIIYNRMK